MRYNVGQSYTPALELNEFMTRSLSIDTETVGKGAEVEIIEIALGDCEGNLVATRTPLPPHLVAARQQDSPGLAQGHLSRPSQLGASRRLPAATPAHRR